MHPFRIFRLALGTAVALGWLALPRTAAGQDAPPANPPAPPAVGATGRISQGEIARFEDFLDQHPAIEARLRENPALTDNPAFQRNHPLFTQFLARHPEIKAELIARPRWFLHRELGLQPGAPVTRAQLNDFDRFLDQHPGLERLLVQHPRLLRQPEFLNHQPELHDYLKQHAGIERAGETRPNRLLRAERKN